ncbi:MAG TPA: DinB family protein [Terriglobales bacterium]
MNTECLRIADQLRRAFEGQAWHGPSLKQLLADVSAEQASMHRIATGHSIWELVSHIEVWTEAAAQAVDGVPMPKIVGTDRDWRPVTEPSARAWTAAMSRLFATGDQLSRAIEQFGDARLGETVPGRQYDFYYLFHGIVQHSLYHGGQLALLKRATQSC